MIILTIFVDPLRVPMVLTYYLTIEVYNGDLTAHRGGIFVARRLLEISNGWHTFLGIYVPDMNPDSQPKCA